MRSLTLGWLLALVPLTGSAAPLAVPRTPALAAPAGDLVLESAPAGTSLAVKFSWTESALHDPTKLATDYFLLCIYDAAAGQTCGWPGSLPPAQEPLIALTAPLGSLSRDAIRSGRPPFQSLSAWRYSMKPSGTLPFRTTTQVLLWTIGACNGPPKPVCSYATPRTVAVTPYDLRLARLRDSAGFPAGSVDFTALVRNEGHVPAGVHATTMKGWRVLRESDCSAQTDYRRANVPANARVITLRGEELSLDQAAASGASVLGIWVPEAARQAQTRSWNALPQGAEQPEMTLTFAEPPLAERPAIFAMWAQVALGSPQLDFDSADNVRAALFCRR